MPSPHDHLFKKIFRKPEAVRELLELADEKGILTSLDLTSLKVENFSFLSENLKQFYSDLIYSCQWKNHFGKAFICFILEHKSYRPNIPHVQLLNYQSLSYDQQLKDNKNQKQLNLIIPVLIYHGNEKWDYRSFDTYFMIPSPRLKQFIPNFNYILIDLNSWSDEKIKKFKHGFITTSLLLMKHKRDVEYLLQHVEEIFIFVSNYQESEEDLLSIRKSIITYLFKTFSFEKQQYKIMIDKMPSEIKPEVKTGFEWLKYFAKKEGRTEGKIEGRIEGKIEGKIEGILMTKLQYALRSMIQLPELTEEEVSKLSDVQLSTIQKLKTAVIRQPIDKAKPVLLNILSNVGEIEEEAIKKLLNTAEVKL